MLKGELAAYKQRAPPHPSGARGSADDGRQHARAGDEAYDDALGLGLVATLAGGLKPLRSAEQTEDRYPLGEAFASGVFLALALAMMLPSSFHLFEKALPHINQPVASFIAMASLLALLGVSHFVQHLEQDLAEGDAAAANPTVPVLMTLMIAMILVMMARLRI